MDQEVQPQGPNEHKSKSGNKGWDNKNKRTAKGDSTAQETSLEKGYGCLDRGLLSRSSGRETGLQIGAWT